MKLIFLIFPLLSVSYGQVVGDIKFHFIGTSTTDYKLLTSGPEFSTVKNTIYYNSSKRTIIFFHGRESNYSEPIMQTIANAYLEN
jgi:hypothetical protein